MQVLIYVDIEGSLYDYCFLGRELSPVSFNDGEIGIGFLAHKPTKKTCLCLFTAVKCLIPAEKAVKEKYQFVIEDDGSGGTDSNKFWTVFKLKYVQIIPAYKLVWKVDAHLASCAVCEINRSKTFRRRFIKYLYRHIGFTLQQEEEIEGFDQSVEIKFVIDIKPQYPIQKIDYPWCYRIEGQVVKRMILEEAMAWLSTLGGGYSSLGEYFKNHAENAGKISFKQLKIAMEMGDPVVAAKCRLFFAQSLMQQGYYKESQLVIRNQARVARSLPVIDDKLLSIIRALRARLKYLIWQNNGLNQDKFFSVVRNL